MEIKRKLIMFQKNLESGRSMVEMLGVLAIIGVLSIGGIAGYSISMTRHRVNQTVDALNKYALIVYTSCQKEFINGDITDLSSCHIPEYEEFDLPKITTIRNFYTAFWPKGLQNMDTDQVAFQLRFNLSDKKLCNTMRSITGFHSKQRCNTGGPTYVFTVKFP